MVSFVSYFNNEKVKKLKTISLKKATFKKTKKSYIWGNKKLKEKK